MFLKTIAVLIFYLSKVFTGKPESLVTTLKESTYKDDFVLSENAVFCKLSYKTTSHFSNVIRHFKSDQHKDKAQWTVKEEEDGTYRIISKVQKTTLLQFFSSKRIVSKTPNPSQLKTKAPTKHAHGSTGSQISVPSLLVKDILDKESAKLSQQTVLDVTKSKDLTKTIMADERLAAVCSGQQNLQFTEQILTFVEYFTHTVNHTVGALLSKLIYMDSVPTFFMLNLHRLSTKITMDVEKSEQKQQELAKLTQKSILERYQSVTSVAEQRKLIQSTCSVDEILTKVKDSAWDETENYPDILLKLSILLEKDNFLSIFLRDIICNMDKRKPTWNEATMSMFSLLLNYGGRATAELVGKNFGGPHLSSVYIKSRQLVNIETVLKLETFSNAAAFYKKILKANYKLKDIMFAIAIDATPFLPLIRARGNTLVGFASADKIEVSNAADIIDAFKSKELTPAQQTYVIILTPLRSDMPYFILAAPPVTCGESHLTVDNWMKNSLAWGKMHDINIYGLGADGDSKIRSYYQRKFLKKVDGNEDENGIHIKRVDFMYYLPKCNDQIECPFPDPRHLKKWRNQILNVRRLLVLGAHAVQLEHLMEIADCETYKHKFGLWKTDIKVNDKQNVNAAVRLFQPNVQECLYVFNEEKFKGTVCFLKIGTMLHQTFFSKEISAVDRIQYAWATVQFVRLWRIWIKLAGYNTEKNFISDQTFKDILIAGHSYILFAKFHFNGHGYQPFEPWMWGSNACEEIFAKARCFVRTKNNFCHLEFLDICKRLQKVSEMEKNPNLKTKGTVCHSSKANYIVEIEQFDTKLVEAMNNGDALACELANTVGFGSVLVSKGILKKTKEGKLKLRNNEILYNAEDVEKYNEQLLQEPDEMKQLSNDEIESLDENEIIHTTFANDKQIIHSADLQDIACDLEINSDNNEAELAHAIPLSTTSQSNFSQGTTSSFTKLSHDLSKSPRMAPVHKSQQQSATSYTEDKCEISESKQNSHILYQGHWYHINKFVSWEQGKFYMPKQARLNRFYSNYDVFDKFMPSDHSSSTIMHGTVIAFWRKGKYVFGFVRRIVKQSVRGKSAFPVFTCDKTSSQDIDFAIQELLPLDSSDTHGLSKYLSSSKHYSWANGKEFVTIVEGHVLENTYTMSDECFSKLAEVLVDLQKKDELEEKRKREESKRKLEERKSGPPEKMTVAILKSVLKEKGIPFPSNLKKAGLVELVKSQIQDIRTAGNSNTSDVNTRTHQAHFRRIQSKKNDIPRCKLHRVKEEDQNKKKRTIYHSYLAIPMDFYKHYIFLIFLYLLESLYMLGVFLTVISIYNFLTIWNLVIAGILLTSAEVNLVDYLTNAKYSFLSFICFHESYKRMSYMHINNPKLLS